MPRRNKKHAKKNKTTPAASSQSQEPTASTDEEDLSQPFRFSSAYEEKAGLYGAAFNPYVDKTKGVDYLATCGGKLITVFRIEQGDKTLEPVQRFNDTARSEDLYSIAWAVDTVDKVHVLAVGGENAIIRIINPLNGETRNILRGHGGAINDIRTSPRNAAIIASASKDHTARVWNVRFKICLASFCGVEGHRDQVLSVDFDCKQEFLLTSSMDHTIRVWDLAKFKDVLATREEDITNPPEWPEEFFPCAIASDIHTNYVDCARFLGTFIFSKSCEKELKIFKLGGYDLPAGGQKTESHPETYTILTAQLSLPDTEMWFNKFDIQLSNNYLACGNEKGTIFLFDMARISGRLRSFAGKEDLTGMIGPIHYHYLLAPPKAVKSSCVRQVQFSPSGRVLISVGDNGEIRRYDRC